MSNRFTGQIVCITGGANGIGRGAAENFAREGAHVVITDMDTEKGDALAKVISENGGAASFIEHDVTSEEQWISVMATISKAHGRLDVLINNAGIGTTGLIHDMDYAAWRKMMAVNVDGVFLGTKHALPLMRRNGKGNIINVSSIAGIRSTPNFSGYCATKAAVKSFTKTTALECAHAKDGIRVNSIHPGIIDTAIWDTLMENMDAAPKEVPRGDVLTGMTADAVPMGRTGTIQEVVNGMLWLASDASSYMTGAELVLDGGSTA